VEIIKQIADRVIEGNVAEVEDKVMVGPLIKIIYKYKVCC